MLRIPLYLLHCLTHHCRSRLRSPLCFWHNHIPARFLEQLSPFSSMSHPLPFLLFNSPPRCCHSNQLALPPSRECRQSTRLLS